jgi:hypothetical protein
MRAPASFVAPLLLLLACERPPSAVPPGAATSSAAAASQVFPLPSAVPTDITLPVTRATSVFPTDALVVVVSRSRVAIGVDGLTLAVSDPSRWEQGLDARYKRGGARGLLVLPLADALALRATEHAGAAPPIVIAADTSVPYSVLIEIVFTLGMSGMDDIALLGRGGAGPATVALCLPRRGANGFPASPGGSKPSLDLTVRLEDAGFVVSVRGQRMAPGCIAAAPASNAGLDATVPKTDGAFDDAQLAACATEIKRSHAAASERNATLIAQPGSDVQAVLSAIDALRGERGELFPEVALGLLRR